MNEVNYEDTVTHKDAVVVDIICKVFAVIGFISIVVILVCLDILITMQIFDVPFDEALWLIFWRG